MLFWFYLLLLNFIFLQQSYVLTKQLYFHIIIWIFIIIKNNHIVFLCRNTYHLLYISSSLKIFNGCDHKQIDKYAIRNISFLIHVKNGVSYKDKYYIFKKKILKFIKGIFSIILTLLGFTLMHSQNQYVVLPQVYESKKCQN